MARSPHFKRLRPWPSPSRLWSAPSRDAFMARLDECVVQPFTRFTGLTAIAVPLDLTALPPEAGKANTPKHPLCADAGCHATCRKEWKAHLAHLRKYAGAHWHRCPFKKLCAVVPLRWEGRCLAALNLVCPGNLAARRFESSVRQLDSLAQLFMAGESEALAKWLGPAKPSGAARKKPPRRVQLTDTGEAPRRHVADALDYIQRHLRELDLSVERVAGAMDLNPDYLAHLFVQQRGEHMNHHITVHRLRFAETLLATTRRPIKEIALRSGFATGAWFRQLFRTRHGISPSKFRRSRGPSSPESA